MAKIKINFLAISVIVMIMTLFAQESHAFFTTIGKATNVITAGEVRMLLHEKTDTGEDFPADGVFVTPGDVVSKIVTIENDCTEPFYLRMKVIYDVDSDELSADCFNVDFNTNDFEYVDGWYYYKEILEPGMTTPSFFTEVEILGHKIDNSYLGKKLTLKVVAHATQSKNNPVEDNKTHTAFGWPQE